MHALIYVFNKQRCPHQVGAVGREGTCPNTASQRPKTLEIVKPSRKNSRKNWSNIMPPRTAKRARTGCMIKALPCLNIHQCQYLETQLKKAKDSIAEHIQVVTIFTLYENFLK